MIVKFDHITHVVNRDSVPLILNQYFEKGYRELFRELRLENCHAKRQFLGYDQEDHDIYFLKNENEEIDIEIIAYTKTTQTQKSKIELLNNHTVSIKTNCVHTARKLFDLMGIKKEDDLYIWGGLLQHSSYRVDFKLEEIIIEGHLDDEGLCCLTLLVDSLEKYRRKLRDSELKCSEICSVCVNSQVLNIMFVSTPDRDVIIEVVSKK